MSGFAFALALVGIVILWLARRERAATGLPWRRVVADDTLHRQAGTSLYSKRYRLTGKPDYILREGGALIPVEVKPSRRSPEPYEGDLLQLAAYCLLIEETTGNAPPYGLLRYADATFAIDWDDALYERLLEALDAVRHDSQQRSVARSHQSPRRCGACGFADRCTEALG